MRCIWLASGFCSGASADRHHGGKRGGSHGSARDAAVCWNAHIVNLSLFLPHVRPRFFERQRLRNCSGR